MCLHAVIDDLQLQSRRIGELEAHFDSFASDDRDSAEIAYAIAYHYMRQGDREEARRWGEKSIAFLARCDTHDELNCLPVHPVIAGIQLPELIHDGVVEFHMRHYWRVLD